MGRLRFRPLSFLDSRAPFAAVDYDLVHAVVVSGRPSSIDGNTMTDAARPSSDANGRWAYVPSTDIRHRHHEPEVRIVSGAVSKVLDDEFALLPESFVASVRKYGGVQRCMLALAFVGDDVVGLLFAVNRPLAAYTKIVQTWTRSDTGIIRTLVDAVEEYAFRTGSVAVKWEYDPNEPVSRLVESLGYEPLRTPLNAAVPIVDASTLAPIRAVVPAGAVKWRTAPIGIRKVGYWRQTTGFTCGAASLMLLFDYLGIGPAPSREAEMQLWREATAGGGMVPWGLAAVAAQRGLRPTVVSTVESPDVVDTSKDVSVRELRRFVSQRFRSVALELGAREVIANFSIDDVRDLVQQSKVAIVQIDVFNQRGVRLPHWVLVHGFHDGVFLVQDSSTDYNHGETWVDLHLHPVPVSTLGAQAWWGQQAYRVMLVFDVGNAVPV